MEYGAVTQWTHTVLGPALGPAQRICAAQGFTLVHAETGGSALPNRAPATVQCRLMPGETPEEVLATLRQVMADPGVAIGVDGPIDPSPETPPAGRLPARYQQAAGDVCPGVAVVPEMSPGASDSVYARLAGLPSYVSSTIFVEDSRAHARDERILVQAFNEAVHYGYQTLKVMSARD